jgi:hypothetical protein
MAYNRRHPRESKLERGTALKRVLVVFAMFAATGMAADITGYVMDKSCSTKKEMRGDEACAKRCLGRGDPAVLVTEEGQIYAVANQEKVKEYAGKKVVVTGKVDGETVTVEKVALPKT